MAAMVVVMAMVMRLKVRLKMMTKVPRASPLAVNRGFGERGNGSRTITIYEFTLGGGYIKLMVGLDWISSSIYSDELITMPENTIGIEIDTWRPAPRPECLTT